MSDVKLKEMITKLAKVVKAQDQKIKKLAQQLSLQEVANKLASEADSLLMTTDKGLGSAFVPGTTKVRLSGDGNDFEGELVVNVKGSPSNLLDVKKRVLEKLNAVAPAISQPNKVNMTVVTFVNV